MFTHVVLRGALFNQTQSVYEDTSFYYYIWLSEVLNWFVCVCLQFVDSSKEPGCPERPEGRKLERRLLLNPNKHDFSRSAHGNAARGPCWFRRAQSWGVTQERVTVNIFKKHYSSLKDKLVSEDSMGPAGWICTLLPAVTQTDTLRVAQAIF